MHIHLHQAEHAVRACMSHRLLLVCILLFSFALRVFELEHLPPFEHPDGVSLAEYSLKVARGDVPWYGVRTDGDTNWAFLQYAPYALFGGSLWALRLTSALWSMLVLTVTYFAVRQMFGARVALFAMLLMGCAHLLIHFSRAVTIVLPSVLTSFLSIGLYCKAQCISADGRRSTGLWLLTGAVLALNLYEYVAARSVFFALAALWLLSLPRQRSAWRPYAHRMLLLAAGFLLIAAPILLWYFQHPNHLLDRFSREMEKRSLTFAPETLDAMTTADWPGNIRQLANEIQRMATLLPEGGIIRPEHLSPAIRTGHHANGYAANGHALTERQADWINQALTRGVMQPQANGAGKRTLAETVEELEKQMIVESLVRLGGNISRAADELGLTRKGLYLKLERYSINLQTIKGGGKASLMA